MMVQQAGCLVSSQCVTKERTAPTEWAMSLGQKCKSGGKIKRENVWAVNESSRGQSLAPKAQVFELQRWSTCHNSLSSNVPCATMCPLSNPKEFCACLEVNNMQTDSSCKYHSLLNCLTFWQEAVAAPARTLPQWISHLSWTLIKLRNEPNMF